MDNISPRMSASMKSFIQHPSMEKFVEPPAGKLVEGKFEILEGRSSNPKSTSVVPEEIFGQRDEFYDRFNAPKTFFLHV